MLEFAKVINVDGGQVLVTKEGWSDEDDAYILKISTMIDAEGVYITMSTSCGYSEENEATYHKMFEEYNQDMAQANRNGMVNFFNNPNG